MQKLDEYKKLLGVSAVHERPKPAKVQAQKNKLSKF